MNADGAAVGGPRTTATVVVGAAVVVGAPVVVVGATVVVGAPVVVDVDGSVLEVDVDGSVLEVLIAELGLVSSSGEAPGSDTVPMASALPGTVATTGDPTVTFDPGAGVCSRMIQGSPSSSSTSITESGKPRLARKPPAKSAFIPTISGTSTRSVIGSVTGGVPEQLVRTSVQMATATEI